MTIYPNVGSINMAATQRAAMAASKLRLFKGTSYIPSSASTAGELNAIEADFSGYPAGGATIAGWQPPLLAPVGGASIDSGLIQFAFTPPDPPATPVVNLVGGWYVTKADGTLIAVGTFPNGIPMSVPGQGIPLNVQLVFGTPI